MKPYGRGPKMSLTGVPDTKAARREAKRDIALRYDSDPTMTELEHYASERVWAAAIFYGRIYEGVSP